MMGEVKVFYLDTSFLLHARHFLACQTAAVPKVYFPPGALTGEKGIQALDVCRRKISAISLVSSTLAEFEMDQRYRRWLTLQHFLANNVPVEAIDSRDKDLFSSKGSLPATEHEILERKIDSSRNWLQTWSYADLVTVDPLNAKIFDVAKPFKAWAPRIELLDVLHVASALHKGAHYFVTDDDVLRDGVGKIDTQLQETGLLPNGDKYFPRLKAINSNGFRQTVRGIRIK